MSESFTCYTCNVGFLDGDYQRLHYKSDWHRYNLKRKVENLDPISKTNFEIKREAAEKALRAENRRGADGDEDKSHCAACSKTFNTEASFENHLNSKKHKEQDKKMKTKKIPNKAVKNMKYDEEMEQDDDEDIEEVDSDEWDDEENIPLTLCLFCDKDSKTLDANLTHMSTYHSFFLPDVEYLNDLPGLVTYLAGKVHYGHMCLWCNEKSKQFHDVSATQKHMTDKGHCKMLYEGKHLAEFADYYDYSSSYPEGLKPDEDPDAEVELTEIDDSGYELILPSGAKVGHRSLMRYYRQSLNPDRTISVRHNKKSLINHYKAIGWTGLTVSEAKKKAKDINFMKSLKQKHYMKLGCSANKLQKYRRDPTIVFG